MNAFHVTVLREANYAVLRTDGYINNLGAERIEQEIEPLIEQGCRRFVINFARSPIINSMGLSILIGIIERMLEVGGVLVFTDLTEVNADLCSKEGFEHMFEIIRINADASIGNGKFYISTRHNFAIFGGVLLINIDSAGFDGKRATVCHCVARIDAEIEQCSFQLMRINKCQLRLWPGMNIDRYVHSERAA